MDYSNETRAYIRKLHRDFVSVQAECERSLQLIRESRQLMVSISQQTNSFMLQRRPAVVKAAVSTSRAENSRYAANGLMG